MRAITTSLVLFLMAGVFTSAILWVASTQGKELNFITTHWKVTWTMVVGLMLYAEAKG